MAERCEEEGRELGQRHGNGASNDGGLLFGGRGARRRKSGLMAGPPLRWFQTKETWEERVGGEGGVRTEVDASVGSTHETD